MYSDDSLLSQHPNLSLRVLEFESFPVRVFRMDMMDESQTISSIIRREAAVSGGYIYLVRLSPSNATLYVRWETLPEPLKESYLSKHPEALREEKSSVFMPPQLLKERKRGPKRKSLSDKASDAGRAMRRRGEDSAARMRK